MEKENYKQNKFNNEFFDFKIQHIKKTYNEEPNQIILSEKLRSKSVFDTEVKHFFSAKIGCNAYGKEKIDEIVKLGTHVYPNDVLIRKYTPIKPPPKTEEDRLLTAMFGEKITDYKDTSLIVPFNVQGEVVDVKKNDLDSVSVNILQKYPISIGDILVDENGNEGVVISFSSSIDNNELIANFDLRTKISRKQMAENSVQMRSTGDYNLKGYPIPKKFYYAEPTNTDLSHIVSGIPQELSAQDIVKFIKNGFSEVLKNIIALQTNQIKNRSNLIYNLVNDRYTDIFNLPSNDINAICCFLKALCLKPVFCDENGKEISFSYTDKNYELNKVYCGKLSFEIDELSDDDILKMSHGEVVHSGMIYSTRKPEKGGLFCEAIFGLEENYACKCEKYVGEQYSEKICEKCRVEITYSDVRYERFGHIELVMPMQHPFIPNRTMSIIPILPPMLRPMVTIGVGRYATDDLNNLYESIIIKNKRLKSSIEIFKSNDSMSSIIEENKQSLQNAINNLFGDADNNCSTQKTIQKKSLIDHLKELFTQHLDCETLDYSASCNVIIDNSLSNEQCGLPFKIAIQLFRTFLVNHLYKAEIVESKSKARHLIIEVFNGSNIDKKSVVIDELQKIINNKRLLIFSKDIDGKVLELSPLVTELDVLTLNSIQYSSLKSKLSESVKIILPISDTAQNMIKNKVDYNNRQLTSIFENEDNTDFVKNLTLASLENRNIIPLLLDIVYKHEICDFNTLTSQYVFGKPSKWACDYYRLPSIEYETSDKKDKIIGNNLEKINNNEGNENEDIDLINFDFTDDELLGFDNCGNGDKILEANELFTIDKK